VSVEIGKRIAARRNELGMTQDDLAKAVDRERHTVSDWENGTRTPRPKAMHAIAQALQIDISKLTGASPPIKKPPPPIIDVAPVRETVRRAKSLTFDMRLELAKTESLLQGLQVTCAALRSEPPPDPHYWPRRWREFCTSNGLSHPIHGVFPPPQCGRRAWLERVSGCVFPTAGRAGLFVKAYDAAFNSVFPDYRGPPV